MCQFAIEVLYLLNLVQRASTIQIKKVDSLANQEGNSTRLTCFARLASVARFSSRLAQDACFFPTLVTGFMFFCSHLSPVAFCSRASQRLNFFPLFAPVAYFPALFSGCMFSRRCRRSRFDWFIASFTSAVIGQMLLL